MGQHAATGALTPNYTTRFGGSPLVATTREWHAHVHFVVFQRQQQQELLHSKQPASIVRRGCRPSGRNKRRQPAEPQGPQSAGVLDDTSSYTCMAWGRVCTDAASSYIKTKRKQQELMLENAPVCISRHSKASPKGTQSFCKLDHT
jgi:hypothetical protein